MQTQQDMRHKIFIAIVGVFFIVVQGCNCSGPDIAVIQQDSQVRREHAEVWAGSAAGGTMPRLTDGIWHALNAGDMVTTDDDGEAWLDIGGCHLIYLFFDSKIIKSACAESDYDAGNVTCAVSGTSVHNNDCSSEVHLQTRSADIVLGGTWVWLTYLPELELTLLVVGEGSAKVWPIREVDGWVRDEPITVKAQEFMFTAPDNRLEEIAGLEPRLSHGVRMLPRLVQILRMRRWLEYVQERAELDKVEFLQATTVSAAPVIVRGAGGALEDSRVSKGLLNVVDWKDVVSLGFPDEEPYAEIDLPGLAASSLSSTFDPDAARALWEEAGYPNGFEVMVLYSMEDKALAESADRMWGYLAEHGLKAGRLEVASGEVDAMVEEFTAGGVSVLWLERQ